MNNELQDSQCACWASPGKNGRINFCPLHASAPALVDALQWLLREASKSSWAHIENVDDCNCKECAMTNARKVVADSMTTRTDGYRNIDCPNCGRHRVESDGVCEKCLWDVDGNDYASITRPDDYNSQGYIFHKPDENLIL